RPPPRLTLFPYTTLFRSRGDARVGEGVALDVDDLDLAAERLLQPCRQVLAVRVRLLQHAYLRLRHVRDDVVQGPDGRAEEGARQDRKSTRLNSSHVAISY